MLNIWVAHQKKNTDWVGEESLMPDLRLTGQPNMVATRACVFLLNLLVSYALFHVGTASAFAVWSFVGFGGPVHQEITRDGLRTIEIHLPSYGNLNFTPAAIEEIVEENRKVDDRQDRPEYHFDNNRLIVSSQRLLSRIQIVVGKLTNSSALTLADAKNVRATLGQALHTLQDFYSHSNWVESGHTGVNPILGNGLLPQEPIATELDQHCDLGRTGRIVTSKLISEFAIGDRLDLQLAIAPPYECAHGLGGNGIHKDWDGRPWYPQARTLATDATRILVQYVLDQATKTNEQSVCVFLGREDCEPTYWVAQYQVTRCTAPTPATFGGEPPCGITYPLSSRNVPSFAPGLFFFVDGVSPIVFADSFPGPGGLGYLATRQESFNATVGSSLSFSQPWGISFVRSDGVTTEFTGTIQRSFLVTSRSNTQITGTLVAQRPYWVFDEFQNITYGGVGSAEGTWSAQLVSGAMPLPKMNGHDICGSDNSAYDFSKSFDRAVYACNPVKLHGWCGVISNGCVINP